MTIAMRLRTPDPFPTLTGRHHYPFDPGTAFNVVYDDENAVELLDVDRRAGVTLVSAEMVVSDNTGGSSILTRAATIVDDGATTGIGTMHFDFTGVECAGWTEPKAFRVNVTDSLGRETLNFDGGFLVPADYMPPGTPEIDHIEISPTGATLRAGEMRRFVAAAYDEDDQALNDRIVSFASSDEMVATVDPASGLVTAYADGVCHITASSSGVQAAAQITVEPTTELSYLDAFFGNDLDAVYSIEANVTESSGVIDSVGDARGGGYGPDAASTGTHRPAYDPVAKTATFDGVDDYLTTALSPLFDLAGAKSLVQVGVFPESVGSVYHDGIAESIAAVRFLGMYQDGGPGGVYRAQVSGSSGSAVVDSGVPVSAVRRLKVVSKSATTAINIDVPEATRVSSTQAGTTAAGSNALTIGGYWPGSASAIVWVRELVIDREITADDLIALSVWAVRWAGAVLV